MRLPSPGVLPVLGGVFVFAAFEMSACLVPSLLPRDFQTHRAKQLLSTQFTAEDPELGYALKVPFSREFHWGDFRLSTRHIPFPGQDLFGYRETPGSSLEDAEIVVLGDSLVYAMEVNAEQTWPGLLGRLGNLKVANLGVAGYGSSQMLGLFKRYASSCRPKLVIAFVHADAPVKDFYLRSWTEDRASGRLHPGQTRFNDYIHQNEMGLPSPLFKMAKTLSRHSLFFKTAIPVMLMVLRSPQARINAVERGSPILRENIIGLSDRVRRSGAAFFVVLEPSWLRADGSGPTAEFTRFLKDARIPFADLGPLFEKNSHQRLRLALDPHWNAAGHALVAEEVFGKLKRLGLIPVRASAPD